MLRIVVPVSQSDVHLLPFFVRVLRHLGPIGDHPVTFVPSPSVVQETINAAKQVELIAPGGVQVMPLNEEPQHGWPLAPNQHFKQTVMILHNMKNRLPWFWCELDQRFLVPKALDMLDQQYQEQVNENGKVFMGTVVPTRLIGKDGVVIENHPEYLPHMVGSGIYPADFMQRVQLWQYIIISPEAYEPIAFDIWLRDEIRPHCYDSPLMQHMWGTVNYHQNGAGIVCEDKPNNPWGTSHCGAIRPGVVVVHGEKDGSLAELICAKDFGVSVPVPKADVQRQIQPATALPATVTQSRSVVTVVPPPPDDRISALEQRVSSIEARLAGFGANIPPPPETDPMADGLMAALTQSRIDELQERASGGASRTPKPIEWGKNPAPAPGASVDLDESPSDTDKVVHLLRSSSKAVKVSTVSAETGLDRAALVALAKSEDSPFEVKGFLLRFKTPVSV